MAHHGQTKQQAGGKHAHNEGTGRDGHQGRKPEAAGVEGQRRAQARRRREPEGIGTGEGVVQQGLHLHAAKTEGGADHQGHEGDGQAHVVDDGAGHGIGLGGGNQGIDHVVQGQQGGAGGDVEHQGNAQDQGEQQEPVPATALPLPLPGEGLLQGSQIIHDVNPETGAARGAHTIQEGC